MPEKSKTYEKSAPRVFIRTFGCQMNDRDSEFIAGLFIDRGYKLVSSPEEADIILFNTCSVREHAEHRAISNMGTLLKVTRSQGHKVTSNKEKIFAIVGCMAQAIGSKLFERLPELDLVCGTGEIARLPELVKRINVLRKEGRGKKEEKILALENIDGDIPEVAVDYRESCKHAYVSIMHGCNNFCSYCIVPYVRGKERSRRAEDIINEVRDLVRKGIRNITLLGQNVNSYKSPSHQVTKSQDCDFVDLLKQINNIEGIEKISFLTSHPKDATIELFKDIRDLDKVVKHLHLPLQSGSNRILKLMNRGYTRKRYLDLVSKAREMVPNLHLTTDIIVGFPTEREEDFNDTLNLMKNIKFDLAYVFKYSPRSGTKAYDLKDDIPQEIKKRRNNTLLDLQRKLKNEKSNCYCRI